MFQGFTEDLGVRYPVLWWVKPRFRRVSSPEALVGVPPWYKPSSASPGRVIPKLIHRARVIRGGNGGVRSPDEGVKSVFRESYRGLGPICRVCNPPKA